MTPSQHAVDLGGYQEDLEADFANEDQTGFVWTWLDTARDQSQIVPSAVLTLRDAKTSRWVRSSTYCPRITESSFTFACCQGRMRTITPPSNGRSPALPDHAGSASRGFTVAKTFLEYDRERRARLSPEGREAIRVFEAACAHSQPSPARLPGQDGLGRKGS